MVRNSLKLEVRHVLSISPVKTVQFLKAWKQLLITTCWGCCLWAAVFLSFQTPQCYWFSLFHSAEQWLTFDQVHS